MATELPLSCELKSYSVLHLWTAVKDKPGDAKPISIKPEIHIKPGKQDYEAFIECKYEIDEFIFECAIEGTFWFVEALSNANVGNAWTNACTMLYGVVRGIFSTAVAQAIHKPYFLPSVMMANFINKRLSELKKEAEENAAKQQSVAVENKAQ